MPVSEAPLPISTSAALALVLVIFGASLRSGFQTMVDYTAPVFWSFFLLCTVALLVLRA